MTDGINLYSCMYVQCNQQQQNDNNKGMYNKEKKHASARAFLEETYEFKEQERGGFFFFGKTKSLRRLSLRETCWLVGGRRGVRGVEDGSRLRERE